MIRKEILKWSVYYMVGMIASVLLSYTILYFAHTSYDFQTLVGIQSGDGHVGEGFPEFNLRTRDGEMTTLNEVISSEYTLVDFWFSGCKPCLKEMKEFPDFLEEHGTDLKIISISIDSFEHMEFVISSNSKPWDFFLDSHSQWVFLSVENGRQSELIKALNVQSYPTYLLLDSNRKIINRPISARLGMNQLFSFVAPMSAIVDIWNSYSFKEKVKFYRVIFIGFNLIVVICVLVYFLLKKIKSFVFISN